MKKTKTLFKSEWLNVLEDDGYIYVEEAKSPAGVVVVLAYKDTPFGRRFLVSMEDRPSHLDGRDAYSLTGGIDSGETSKAAAVRELREEAGISIKEHDLQNLGHAWPYKASSCVTHIYAVNVLDSPGGKEDFPKGSGDGTDGEKGNFCAWADSDAIIDCIDPLLHTAYLRLNKRQ